MTKAEWEQALRATRDAHRAVFLASPLTRRRWTYSGGVYTVYAPDQVTPEATFTDEEWQALTQWVSASDVKIMTRLDEE